jgi:hypothetical protein
MHFPEHVSSRLSAKTRSQKNYRPAQEAQLKNRAISYSFGYSMSNFAHNHLLDLVRQTNNNRRLSIVSNKS